jgi:single-strand DNA-binding protein
MIIATVTGNLGRDPEMRDTKTGKKMATFSVASTTKRDGRDPETTWVEMVCFDDIAGGVAGNLRKGMKVIAKGQLAQESFQRQDGTEGSKVRMVVNDIGLMIRDKGEPAEEPRQQKAPARQGGREPW